MQLQQLRSPSYVWPVLLWSLLLGSLPSGNAGMVDSQDEGEIEKSIREAHQTKIRVFFAQQRIQQHLAEKGLSADEIASRLERLPDRELEQVSRKLEALEAGQGLFFIFTLILTFGVVWLLACALSSLPQQRESGQSEGLRSGYETELK